MKTCRRWYPASALVALALAIGLCVEVRAEPQGPGDMDADIARTVAAIMETGHITRHRVDDTISQRLHKSYLQSFDPLKLYFLTSDIDEFHQTINNHDDTIARGDLSFAFTVYNRFLKRVDERCDWAIEFANSVKDFAKEEAMHVDGATAQYAKTADEAKERWRVRVKYELESLLVDGKKEDEARDRLRRRYTNLKKRWHQVDADELVEMYLTSLTSAYDPHSTFMSGRTWADFKISLQLKLEGIGALLQAEDGITTIKEVVPGGAAAKDGRLKPGDKIVGVGEGHNGELADIVDMKLRDVVKRIRGAAGTFVRLEVTPANSQQRVIYELQRQVIALEDREAKGEVVETPKLASGAAYHIGVIKLPSFYADDEAPKRGPVRTATNDVRRILDDFKKKHVDCVVMDLRMNGGGLLNEAIDLTGLFIDKGPIVQVRDFNGRVTAYMDQNAGVSWGGPLIVLVNKFSASASEIFAGAIQDYGRGLVVGDSSTHGKGSVQKIHDLARQFGVDDVGAVKLTMQKFYRVNGQSTQNRGVLSDIVLPSISDNDEFGEAKLDYALPFDQIDPADYARLGWTDEALVKQLRELSQERQAKNVDLVKLAQRKELVRQRRDRKDLTFNEAKLRAESKELSPEDKKEAELDDDDMGAKKDKPFGTDAYTKEVLTITGDYIRLRGSSLTAR